MGKTSRKTKAKKADFNKVKLKAGKKRPLPNNVTKTDFKAQSVFVSTQFRNVQSEGVANKPTLADLKECLSRLVHPAPTRRYQSLKSIKAIIMSTPDARFLPRIEISEKVMRTISDVDSEVRKACLEVLPVLFKVFPPHEMKHHFALTLRFIKCAMLHLNKATQLDSLKALDFILDDYSELMDETYSFEMLTIFLDMISMKTQDKRRVLMATGSGKLGADKTTSLSWYLQVFQRTYRLLLASNPRKQRNWDNPKKERVFDCWNSWRDMPWSIRPGNPWIQSSRLQYKPNHKREVTFEDLQAMSGEIYSLLIQCWREVTLSDDCYIGEYTSSIMNISLQITVQLVEYLLRSTGRRYAMKFVDDVFVASFNKHFFSNFPFEIDDTDENGVRKRKRRRRNDTNKNKSNNGGGGGGGARRNLMLLNIAVCKLYTIVYPDEKKDMEKLKDMSHFLTRFLARSSITHLLQKNDENDVDLLRQSLDICDELVKIGNPEVSQPIASVMVKMYERNNRSEKGLPFIQFLSKNYDMDYILPTGENEFTRYFSTILDTLLHYMELMSGNKVDGKCAIADENLASDVTYRHFDWIFRLIQHAHVKREACYVRQVEGRIIKLLQLMRSGNLFCSHDAKCYDCLRCQMDLVTCLLPHVKVLNGDLVKTLANYSVSRPSNKQVMHFIADELEKFIHNYEDRYDDEATVEENKLQVAQYYRIILFGGTADAVEIVESMNDSDLARVADNCDYVLQTWKRLPLTLPSIFLLQQTLEFYFTNFFQYTISALPRSWAGFLRCFIFIQKQPYASDFERFHQEIGSFLAKIVKCSIDGKYESMLVSACQVFNSHLQLREACLTKLINDDSDEGLYSLLELAKRPDFGASLSAMAGYIVGKLRELMPTNTEDATARSRTTETIIALLEPHVY